MLDTYYSEKTNILRRRPKEEVLWERLCRRFDSKFHVDGPVTENAQPPRFTCWVVVKLLCVVCIEQGWRERSWAGDEVWQPTAAAAVFTADAHWEVECLRTTGCYSPVWYDLVTCSCHFCSNNVKCSERMLTLLAFLIQEIKITFLHVKNVDSIPIVPQVGLVLISCLLGRQPMGDSTRSHKPSSCLPLSWQTGGYIPGCWVSPPLAGVSLCCLVKRGNICEELALDHCGTAEWLRIEPANSRSLVQCPACCATIRYINMYYYCFQCW